MNQKSTLSRYYFALCRYLVLNRRVLVLMAVLIFGLEMMMGAVIGYFSDGEVTKATAGLVPATVMLFGSYIVIGAMASIAASLAFGSLSTRTSRLATLMLPESAACKFWVRITVYVIFFWIAAAAALALAEVVRLWVSVDGCLTIIGCFDTSSEFTMPSTGSGLLLAIWLMQIVLAQGYYTLGSALWPRWSFVKTFVASYILSTIFGLALVLAVTLFDPGWELAGDTVAIWMLSTMGVLTAACYAGAWLRFDRVQLVQRFMMR